MLPLHPVSHSDYAYVQPAHDVHVRFMQLQPQRAQDLSEEPNTTN
jgi:hypothetical protein